MNTQRGYTNHSSSHSSLVPKAGSEPRSDMVTAGQFVLLSRGLNEKASAVQSGKASRLFLLYSKCNSLLSQLECLIVRGSGSSLHMAGTQWQWIQCRILSRASVECLSALPRLLPQWPTANLSPLASGWAASADYCLLRTWKHSSGKPLPVAHIASP